MTASAQTGDVAPLRDHRRQWRRCLYVYPVISRRAKGLSIGVNLNPDKRCNFSCVYCQIDRRVARNLRRVKLAVLADELREALSAEQSGELWREPRFAPTPPAMRRLNDIAFSGDGEPTCLDAFDRAVAVAAEVKGEFRRDDVKIIVITNASHLDAAAVRRALPMLDANKGEIWAKLDAGTEERFRRINRPHPKMTLEHVVDNILAVALGRPVVIQTLLARLDGAPPDDDELAAYCARLRKIVGNGGRIRLVQLHTIARPPAEACVAALADEQLEAIADTVREALPDIAVETYGGADVPPHGR